MRRHIPLLFLAAVTTLSGGQRSEEAGSKDRTARALPAITVRGVAFEMIQAPAGEFIMGSERQGEQPRHKVRIRSFGLGRTEVTVRQFRAFVAATDYRTDAEREGTTFVCKGPADGTAGWRSRGYWADVEGANWRNPGFAQSDDDPVVALSWHDAMAFAAWLSKETGREFRLPSEAEWEYAARAGTESDAPDNTAEQSWWRDNSNGRTHPVAVKMANAWGLHDMLGNAWEWVADVWASGYDGAPVDGSPRREGGQAWGQFKAGDGRPLRGGAWGLEREELRYAGRPAFGSHQRCNNSGFRIALTLDSK